MTDKEFSRLYGVSRANFERIAYSYVFDREAARDIVTECFLYLWEHRDEVGEDNITGYVYMAVRHRCFSYLRKMQSKEKAEEGLAGLTKMLVETSLSNLSETNPAYLPEIEAIFRKALKNMPSLTRKVFLASREQELTYGEIACKYNIPVRKVASEIQSALRILRDFLKDY